MCAVLINIRCNEFSVVVTDAALVDSTADRSLNMHFSFRWGIVFPQEGFDTINAKILLSLLNGATKAFAAAFLCTPFGRAPPSLAVSGIARFFMRRLRQDISSGCPC